MELQLVDSSTGTYLVDSSPILCFWPFVNFVLCMTIIQLVFCHSLVIFKHCNLMFQSFFVWKLWCFHRKKDNALAGMDNAATPPMTPSRYDGSDRIRGLAWDRDAASELSQARQAFRKIL